MATYEITGPDGKKYRVTGETPEGAAQAVATMIGGGEQQPQERVIATTANEGRIIERADGSRVFASPGYSTTDPEAVSRLMEGATPLEVAQSTTDRLTIAQHPIAARAQEVNQGAPFVGQWLDEAVGVVNPQAGRAMDQLSDAMERERPGETTALNIVGGIGYGAPLVSGGVSWASRGRNLATQAGRGAAVAAPAAAAEMASSEAGRADPGQRTEAAIRGAGTGAALGAALGGILPVGAAGIKAVATRIKKLDVRTIMDEFGVSAPAARTMRSALANDDLNAAAQVIQRGGDDAMLADAGQSTRSLLDASSQTGGRALAVSTQRIQQRANEAGVAFKKSLDDTLGQPRGVSSTAEGIAAATARPRRIAYDRAYSSPIDYAAEGRQIEDVLSRIPPRTVQAAVNEANDAMRAAGVTNRQILAEIADDGSVTFREMPNVQQLDEIKKALGEIANREVDQFGRKTAAGNRAAKLAAQLRDAISDAVPAYKNALRLGGDKLQMDEAFETGLNLLSPRTKLEDVVKASKTWRSGTAGNLPVPMNLAGAPTSTRDAAKQGLREAIEGVMGRARTTLAEIEGGNFDFQTGQNAAKEALDALRALTTPDNFKKARLVLGTDAKKLFDQLQKTSDAMALRAAMAKNSATAVRQAIQGEARAQMQPGAIREFAGSVLDPSRGFGLADLPRRLVALDARSMSEAERSMMAEISDALTRIRGGDAEKALRAVNQAMQGQPIKEAEARLISDVLTSVGGSAAYQSGEQYLPQLLRGTPQLEAVPRAAPSEARATIRSRK